MSWDPEDRKAFFAKKEALRMERQKKHEASLAADAAKRAARAMRPVNPGATRFTTDAAVAWGRSQGWKLIERETYDFRNKRHRDTMLASDALFDDGGVGMIAVQGAGLNERETHRRKFEERGGVELAKRRAVRFVYAEFVRGRPEPIKVEWWS